MGVSHKNVSLKLISSIVPFFSFISRRRATRERLPGWLPWAYLMLGTGYLLFLPRLSVSTFGPLRSYQSSSTDLASRSTQRMRSVQSAPLLVIAWEITPWAVLRPMTELPGTTHSVTSFTRRQQVQILAHQRRRDICSLAQLPDLVM